MDEKQGVSLRLSDFLFYHVFSDALEYLSGIFRSPGFETGRDPVVDIQASVELGISWHAVS